MSTRLRVAGHPLHPALAHFPIALWTVAPVADLFSAWANAPAAAVLGWWSLAGGVAAGVPAMLAGAADYAALPRQHAAHDTAVSHMLAMTSAWLLFMLVLALRGWPPEAHLPSVALGVELLGLFVVLVGGWLGGTLVYRFRVGVDADDGPGSRATHASATHTGADGPPS